MAFTKDQPAQESEGKTNKELLKRGRNTGTGQEKVANLSENSWKRPGKLRIPKTLPSWACFGQRAKLINTLRLAKKWSFILEEKTKMCILTSL